MASNIVSKGTKKFVLDASLRRVAPITTACYTAAVNVRSSMMPPELLQSSQAFLSAATQGGKPTLPALSYDYNALEPAISKTVMELHHTKHHQAYVTNFNVALEKLDKAVGLADVNTIIALQPALKFNGGGHLNHTLFWENLAPPNATGSVGPSTQAALDTSFGGFDAMKQELSTKSIAVQGSGWGWLAYNSTTGRLEVATCANQDPLQATTGLIPLLGIDVWEHAYYLDRQNRRPEYVEAIWSVINWNKVEERLVQAKK